MGFVIGMDEAGYGPNLGPLVLTATVWEVPGRWPKKTDFWKTFDSVAQREIAKQKKGVSGKKAGAEDGVDGDSANRPSADDRLHIADSKEVYCPATGLGALERGALAAFGVASRVPSDFDELLDELWGRSFDEQTGTDSCSRGRDLWFSDDVSLPLPLSEQGRSAAVAAQKWRDVCDATGVCLRSIRCDVVAPRRWNMATRETDNKATALSRLHLQLLRRVWDPDTSGPTIVLADKHGGRNRYAELLTECVDGRMVWCRQESRDSSVYRIGPTEIHFEARAERHFPVALASMVSKYVRELAMELFNRFWRTHLPELKPTHGYPTDARRFREEVAEMQARLEIPDEMFWRER
jgi:ribonuclease HII